MFLRLRGLQVYYKVFGSGENLIFLSGWGAPVNHYAALHEHLAKKFRVFAIDLPGMGLSAPPDTIWGTKEYAELVLEFVTALKIKNPIIVGHSLGGKIAIYLTANKLIVPEKLVLISSAGIKLPKTFQQRAKIFFYKAFKIIATLPVFRSFLLTKLENYKNKVGSNDYKNASGIMRSILVKLVNENFYDLLPSINIPTTLIWGDHDTSTALLTGKMMHSMIVNSHLEIINGAGHFSYLDDFDKFIGILDKYL